MRQKEPGPKRYVKDALEITLAVIAAWVAYQVLAGVLNTPMPMLAVVSGSMEPTLHVGDLIIVQRVEYQVGDIAIYFRDRTTIVHRVIEIRPEGYIFKGDNNSGPDPAIVRNEEVLGKVRLAIPLLGWPRLALYSIGI